MSDSIAGLAFNIDSSQTATAAQNLNALTAAADKTAESQDRFNQHTQRFIAVAHDLSGSIAELRRQYQETSATIDQSVETLDRWQQKAGQSAQAFSVFDEARKHVDALGASFGATSTAIQLFYDRAQQLTLNSGETTLALQRITSAIQGQTTGGLSVRHDLDLLGVNSGSDSNNADQVLAQVVARLRTYRDSPEKTRLAQEFGISDPDTLYSLSQPTYIPVAQQRQINVARDDHQRQAEAGRFASQLTTASDRDYAERSDLEGVGRLQGLLNGSIGGFLGLDGRYNLSNLSATQSADLARQVGLPTDLPLGDQNNANRLTALRALRDNPTGSLARGAETLPSRIGDYFRSSYAGRELHYLTSGDEAANAAAIYSEQQTLIDSASPINTQDGGGDLRLRSLGVAPSARTSSLDRYLSGTFQTVGRRVRAFFDPDTRIQSLSDPRALLPQDRVLNDQTTAEVLGNAGYDDVGRYQEARSKLNALGDDHGDLLNRFTGAYGAEEGRARFNQYRERLLAQQRDALIPDADKLRQSQQQAYLASFSASDRSEASAYLAFAPGDTTRLTGGRGPTTLAGLESSGAATPSQLVGFKAAFGAGRKSDDDEATSAARDTISNLGKLAEAAARGSDALDQARTYQEAYNAAISRPHGASPEQADEAGRNAVREAQARAVLSNQSGIADQRRHTDQEYSLTSARYAGQSIGGAQGAYLTRDAETVAQFAEQMHKLEATGGQQAAVASLQSLIEHIRQLGDVSAQAAADAGNLSAARSLSASSDVDRAVAGAPAAQRPYLRALGSAYQENLTNPAFDTSSNRPALSETDMGMINSAAGRYPGASPTLLAALARREGAGDQSLANPTQIGADTSATYGFAPVSSRADGFDQEAAIVSHLSAMPGIGQNPAYIAGAYNRGPAYPPLQRLIASGGHDFSGYGEATKQYPHGDAQGQAYVQAFQQPTFPEYMHTPNGAIQGRNAAAVDSVSAAAAAREASARDAFAARTSVNPTVDQLLSQGRTGEASIAGARYSANPEDPNAASETGRRVADVQAEQATAYARTTGEIRQQAEASQRLADASAQGYAAVQAATEKNSLYAETLSNVAAKQNEAALSADIHARALAKVNEQAGQQHLEDTNKIAATDFESSLGIIGDQDKARALNNFATQQSADRQNLTGPARTTFVKDQETAFNANETLENVRRANDVFKQLGDTILDTFTRGLQGGESFKHLVGDLFTQIGAEVEKALLQKPLENLLQSGVGSLFGTSLTGATGAGTFAGLFSSIGGWLGIGGGAASGGAADFSTPAIGYSARGNAFVDGFPVRYHATGSVVNTPTAFQTADGASNMMGEAGNEAVLPLQVMPNGNLGVAAGGGGGGSSIAIHAPVYIQGGGGNNGQGMDPQTAAKYQKHVQMAIRQAVQAEIIQQGRPGGTIYQSEQS